MEPERVTTERKPRLSARRLYALAAPEWKRLLVGTIFLAIGSGAGLVYPQAARVILDEAITSKSSSFIDYAAIALIAIFAVQSVATALRYFLFTVAGERIVVKLRQRLYAAIVQQEIAFFDERRTGELMNRLSSDTTVLQNTVSTNISMVLRNIASAIGGVVLLFYTSPLLAAMMLVVVPAIAVGAVWYGRRLRRLSRKVQDALARASEVAEETIGGIRTVRAFTAEALEADRYRSRVEESFELAKKRALVGGIFSGVVSFIGLGAAVLVLWYGTHMVIAKEMSIGELMQFLIYTVIVGVSFGALSGLYADFMNATGASQRVFELLDRQPGMTSSGDRKPSIEGSLAFEDVRFVYPTRADIVVLDGVDFSLERGKVLALVGPSGSGKSTIASLIGRLYDPEGGIIRLDGADIRTLDPDWLRRQIGVVAQEPILFSTSIKENIRYGRPTASDEEVEQAAIAANAHDFIARFPEGYATEVGERGIQLSGGQKQRVAIARALLKDPRILILDEATSALDAESEHLVKEALERLMQGRTTLIIAHRLSTVADADEVAVLDGGKIVQRGDHQSLLREEGLYKQLVERQFVAA
jgi:ABC transporter fused permease/ATP-binding protein